MRDLLPKNKLYRLLIYFVGSIFLSILYYSILSQFVYLGEDKRLKNENRILKEIINHNEQRLVTLEKSVNSLSSRDRKIYKSIFGAYPIDDLSENVDMGSSTLDNILQGANEIKLMFDTIKSNLDYLGNSSKNIPAKLPIENFSIYQLGAGMGKKINPFYKSLVPHRGLDIVAPIKTKVIATADGIVDEVYSREGKSEGLLVCIDHINGYKTRYSHLNSTLVSKGQKVKQGQIIGTVGSTGMSLVPHLHYEVIFNGRYLNPINYFFGDVTPSIYQKMIVIEENTGQSLD